MGATRSTIALPGVEELELIEGLTSGELTASDLIGKRQIKAEHLLQALLKLHRELDLVSILKSTVGGPEGAWKLEDILREAESFT